MLLLHARRETIPRHRAPPMSAALAHLGEIDLRLPPDMDGRQGTNRAPLSVPKQIRADDDVAAIGLWLVEYVSRLRCTALSLIRRPPRMTLQER
jgi:hypothetical protein